MECNDGKPILFDAIANTENPMMNGYSGRLAMSFVNNQRYINITHPEKALIAGTMFCDLYMPYTEKLPGSDCPCNS